VTDPLDTPPAWLLGAWHLIRAESPLELQPGTRMNFGAGGQLEYAITVEGHTTRFALVYRVRGDVLRTENPASPHSAEVHVALGEGDILVLDFGGPRAWFAREYR
jgi:hypothetical protein